MTLQYRPSDGKLLYLLCGSSSKRNRLMADCCCPGPVACTDCADYFDITISTSYSGSIWNGVFTVGPKIISTGGRCRWTELTVNYDCGGGVTAKFYIDLIWNCSYDYSAELHAGRWYVTVTGDYACPNTADKIVYWGKTRTDVCDIEGAYPQLYTNLGGFEGTCVVSEH